MRGRARPAIADGRARSRAKSDRKSEAARLRRLRATLGLTQRELAVEFKVAHGAIAAWESGTRTLPGPAVRLLELYEEELSLGPDDGLAKLKTTTAARTFALSKAAGGVMVRMAAATLERMLADDAHAGAITRRTQVAVARNVVEALGALKGVAMKVGQTFATWDFAIPDASQAELRTLLTSSRPMSPAAIAQVVLEELGAPPRQIFAEWSLTPFAAASIGQVHRARLPSGEEVAVKVQYPAIVDAVTANLQSAVLVDRLAGLLFRGQEPGVFVDELRERFLEECDYRLEAEHQESFRKTWLARPGVRIPRVYTELSTRRVLVTELCQAEGFESFVAGASRAAKNRAALTIGRFALESMFRHGRFNADQHPGNFLFEGGDVVFLDFGCVKRPAPAFAAAWRRFTRAALERDRQQARAAFIDMRMLLDPERYDYDYHWRMIVAATRAFPLGAVSLHPRVRRTGLADADDREPQQVPHQHPEGLGLRHPRALGPLLDPRPPRRRRRLPRGAAAAPVRAGRSAPNSLHRGGDRGGVRMRAAGRTEIGSRTRNSKPTERARRSSGASGA